MFKIGIIGGGQLARMMIPAAINLGLEVRVFAESENEPAKLAVTQIGDYRVQSQLEEFARSVDVITFDHEHVPTSSLLALQEKGFRIAPSPQALSLTHNKIAMREALQTINCPQPLWSVATGEIDRENALAEVGGFPCIAKKPIGGYDGKGVRLISSWSEIGDWLSEGPVLLEERVQFIREMAQLVARREGGEIKGWPVVETRQSEGVCSEVFAPAPDLAEDKSMTAKTIAETIAESFGIVGVLAVELFETGDGKVLVNELAMRPHNSGHIFTELSRTSQFEQHLRAVADMPLGDVALAWPRGVMANIFGEVNPDRLAFALEQYPQAKVHPYQKPPRTGRKAGHVSVVGSDLDELFSMASGVRAILGDSSYAG
ncbi:MAG: 5-(carboxyamino)imidazole ribonucleotide synthase [Verrucomicrobia bacterium]|nr:5-(carboxyamino)imidazole ribonucleotide synthase [Verrucomicrobiota bacterium]